MSQRVAPFLCTLLLAVGLATSASVALGGAIAEPLPPAPAATPVERVCPPVVLELDPATSEAVEGDGLVRIRGGGQGSASDPIVTSDYSNLTAGAVRGRLGRERKDGSRGRARMTISIESEPLVHNMDELAHAAVLAAAAAEHLKKKVRAINEPVSVGTLETRKYQEKAHADGKPWAVKRFGFRGGNHPPRSGEMRMFNHSGTFAEGIVATRNQTEGNVTINVPANRLDPRTSQNAAEFAHITDALLRLVPELQNPAMLMNEPEVRAALDVSLEQLVVNAAKRHRALKGQLSETILRPFLDQLGVSGIVRGVQKTFY